ncbi:MAG: hypothetical protein HYY49_02035 [Ignavibacteriales bacterium]|nr:hypothetical protein [Ignavibacteriales bacterium]
MMNLILTLRDAEYERTSAASTIQNLATAARVIEKDLKYAGYYADTTAITAFLVATNDRVQFVGDIDNNLLIDTIDIWLADDPSGEPNSKVIARKVGNGLPLYLAQGSVSMNLQYYDSLGVATLVTNEILAISVLLSQRNEYSMTDTSSSVIKREVLVFPANLQ